MPRRAAAPPRTPAPPKEFDWGWLAEQQANLFLFAGAFLTVVAALIYVGYSGQAVSGALKMTLLAAYTFAFLAAGAFCLRVKRVEMAGRVFFAIGGLLVPLNFVAARTIFGEEDFSAQSMWLAGSICAAAFYTSIAYLGLGRAYTFGAGVALVSAVLAFAVVVEMPVEWAPALFIALAAGMSLTSIAGPATLRSRIGEIWTQQAHAVAIVATVFGLGVALYAASVNADDEVFEAVDLTTRWFLPLTFLGFTAYAALHMVAGRKIEAGIAAILGFGAAFVSTMFAVDATAEFYAMALALLAVAFGGMMLAAAQPRAAVPQGFDDTLRWAAAASTGLALFVAFMILQATANETDPYEIDSRWFLPATFALTACFYAIDALVRRDRWGAAALVVALTGVSGSTAYAFDVPPEYYAFFFLLPAVAFAALARWATHPLLERLAGAWREDTIALSYGASAIGVAIALGAAFAGTAEDAPYEPGFRWYLPLSFAIAIVFGAIDATRASRPGAIAVAAAVAGFGAGIVYAMDPSAELYAYGFFGGAIAIAAAARFAPERWTSQLSRAWRDDAMIIGHLATGIGLAITIGALGVYEDRTTNPYAPETRWFLGMAFTTAAVFLALDASRKHETYAELWTPGLSAALLVTLTAAAVAVPYALEAEAEYYGAALAIAAIVISAGGRAWTPSWLNARVRDAVAAAGVTASWLLFEDAYGEAERIGAAVHFAAALFYAGAALTDRNTRTLGQFLDVPQAERVRLAHGWLYAAGVTALIGYVYTLQSLPSAEDAEGGPMAVSLTLAALAFALAGAAVRLWRPEFRMHFYAMALGVALLSLAAGPDAGTLTAILAVYVATFAAIAAYEDAPMLAAPCAVFGLALVPAWREYADAGWWTLPGAYSAIAVAMGAAAAGLTAQPWAVPQSRKKWLLALGGAAAVFAVSAPAVGFVLLSSQADEFGYVDGAPFYETALYQWSTISVAVAGGLLLAAAPALGRKWIVVPATTILTIALLLQIGRFNPGNAQAYTAVIGAYLVGLGLLGLWRYRLVPEIDEAAPYVEALGAAIIMLPSFAQSIDAGWRYQWIMLAEAIVFFAASVTLKRRGMLAASLIAMVLVAGRALFDAVNALPNWVVVMIAGVGLLGVGIGILLGRERWSRWEEAVMGWWESAGRRRSEV